MAKAVICPPWISTFLVVLGRETTVLVGVLGFGRRRLRRAFAQAGIAPRERWGGRSLSARCTAAPNAATKGEWL
jgi:hypothetical protein